jgi:PTS system glucitol/sorbitol-specific IIC component
MHDKPEQNQFIDFAKQTNDFFKRRILPVLKMMAPSFLLGLVIFMILLFTGLGDMLGDSLAALTGTIPAVLIIFAACLIPALSPVLGPGLFAAIAAGILTGEQIAAGAATPLMALPALLAIDAQIGGSFIPPGFALGVNEPETINTGVPEIVFTRLITVPAAVLLTGFFSLVL